MAPIQSSFLQQLVNSSPNNPDLISTLQRHQKGKQLLNQSSAGTSNISVTRSPSCVASLATVNQSQHRFYNNNGNHHQRSVSMLAAGENVSKPCGQDRRFQKKAGADKHRRSSSTLVQVTNYGHLPHQRQVNIASEILAERPEPTGAPAPDHSKSSSQLLQGKKRDPNSKRLLTHHKSTSNLCLMPDGSLRIEENIHKRSSSTPYEGFVV